MNWTFVAILAAAITTASAGQESAENLRKSLEPMMDALSKVHRFTQVAISPDGTRVAWVEESEIMSADLRDGAAPPHRVAIASGAGTRDMAWSPDGMQIAFLSDAGAADQLQVFVVSPTGGEPRQLTHLTGFLAEPRWSPDGKTIALLFTENAPRAAGPLQPMSRETGVIGSRIYEQRLTTVDVATGQTREVTPADLYIYEYDWSPDSRNLVATAAHGIGDDNWYVAELYIVSATSGEMKSIYKPPLQIAAPRWSPDGNSIAFIGGLMSDEGSTGGDVFVIPAAGGAPHNLTPKLKASAASLAWMPSSASLSVMENLDGAPAIATLDVAKGEAKVLWTGPEVISEGGWGYGLSLSADGQNSAVVRESFAHPPEVWAGPVGEWKQVTSLNHAFHPDWGKAESIHWRSAGLRVQGWLLYPKDYDPGKRYPMVVMVHGGPGAASSPGWPKTFLNYAMLSSAGYFVLLPNPRGSFGQGEAFTRANVKDFGYGDLRDILAGVDEVVKTLAVDDHRIGITGWSYGGFMTMWAITQTHRFRAAVSGAGLANWLSYYGENDLDQWMIPFFGASVYDDPAVYAKSSPINFIKNVSTPTLLVVGERDGECPAPQSYEYWHVLKTLGVPTQLVVYPDEGHFISVPADQRDIALRMLDWFDRYLK